MILLSLILAPLVLANTWTVDAGGSGDFLTIQAAIDASTSGDVIQVTPGIYEEDLLVHVSVTIEGLSGGAITIHPATSNPGTGLGAQILTTTQSCIVQASDVTLRGLVFNGNNPNLSADVDVRNGIITNYTNGPWHRLTVEDCKVRNILLRAIYGSGGTDHLFRGNTVRNAKGLSLESSGLMLWGATGVMENNTITQCSLGITNHAGAAGDIRNNHVSNCDIGVLTNGTNAPSVVHDNTFEDCTQGHQLIGLQADVTSRNNLFLRCNWGVIFFGSNGQGFIEDNIFDAESLTGSVGIKTNTDLAPWGTNDVIGHVQGNEFNNLTTGILLQETSASRPDLTGMLIGGSALESNSFRNIQNLYMRMLGCDDNINATFNSWGVATAAAIESSIYHQVDDPAQGLVDFSNALADLVIVDAAGGGDFYTIQEGIDAVDPGGTVSVAPGEYVGSLVVHQSMTLAGSGNDTNPLISTQIVGDNLGYGIGNDVITVIADGVEIRDLHVQAWSPVFHKRFGAGVIFDHTNNGVARDVVVENGIYGIYSYFSTNAHVENCVVVNCGKDLEEGGGIVFSDSTGTIGGVGVGNSTDDSLGIGFLSTSNSATTMTDNLATNCEIGFVSQGAAGLTVFQGNGANACKVGFQGIANNADVNFVDNTSRNLPFQSAGYSLFGNGIGHYLLTGNSSDGSGSAAYSLYVNPNAQFGSSDIHVVLRDNCFLNSSNGIFVDERGGNSFLVDLDLSGAGGGHNIIAGQQQYAVYLKRCNDSVEMPSNYWGTTDPLAIGNRVYDSADDPALGTVNYATPLAPTPDLRVDAVHRSTDYQVQIIVTGNPGDRFTLGGSLSLGSWATPWGTLSISEADSFEIFSHRIPASGVFLTRGPSIAGLTGPVYLQGLVLGSSGAITNLEEILLRPAP